MWEAKYSPCLAPQEYLDGEREIVVAPAGAVVFSLVPVPHHVAVRVVGVLQI